MEVILLTTLFSVLFAVFFLLLFLRTRTARSGSVEQDALLPFAGEFESQLRPSSVPAPGSDTPPPSPTGSSKAKLHDIERSCTGRCSACRKGSPCHD